MKQLDKMPFWINYGSDFANHLLSISTSDQEETVYLSSIQSTELVPGRYKAISRLAREALTRDSGKSFSLLERFKGIPRFCVCNQQ